MNCLVTLFAAALLGPTALAGEGDTGAPAAGDAAADEPWEDDGLGFGGVPALNYNSDDGFGYGVLGSIYGYDTHTAPYKWSTTFLIFLTTKKIQNHRVDLDVLDAFGLPLRLTTRLEFYATRSANYCGLEPADFCDDVGGPSAEASAAAIALGLADDPETGDDEYDAFVRRYYKMRYTAINTRLLARYALTELPRKLELMGGWWSSALTPGSYAEPEPFPGSLYAQDFPEGERGFVSTLQGGLMLDSRDNEPAPTSGYWIEGSIRGASPYWGSDWSYFGYNATLRGYLPLLPSRRLVLASREIADGVLGDPPVVELAQAGGSQIISFFGGQYTGRGVRSTGLLGKARFFGQNELRWTALSFKAADVPIDVTLLGFADVGYVAADFDQLFTDQAVLFVGEGAGLRLAFNKNFIIRVDKGWSSMDNGGLYINVNNLF